MPPKADPERARRYGVQSNPSFRRGKKRTARDADL
eukprot:CAMPEP_0182547824 /NCGR_PEP_ID=MMETSP1323-20130603/37989_1 /TAXON_ID=236787 /ORGANISM="Florenciella parvula, Strain RCC1693" /LENGTH=34 /DNA_ID= /DNA_START= /DNA_END= /DNA_ORIENTATION=